MKFDSYAAFRLFFCRVFCPCEHHHRRSKFAVLRLSSGSAAITCLTTSKGVFMATVPASGGPFRAEITGFVDDKGNTTTENDVPVWASSDETIATVAVDGSNPQAADVTLTGKTGQAQITASFPGSDAGGSGASYVVTGMLDVQPGEAVSASMSFSGPGV